MADVITRRWFNVEWASEGQESNTYNVEENLQGYVRWKCLTGIDQWSEWFPKKDVIQDFIYLIEHLWVIQNQCRCSAQQLLWAGHEPKCSHYKKKS